jgi:hypothetical protein
LFPGAAASRVRRAERTRSDGGFFENLPKERTKNEENDQTTTKGRPELPRKNQNCSKFFIHLLTLGIAGVEPNKKRPREKSTPELGTETLFKVVKVSEPQGSTSGPVLLIHWYRETEKKK